MDYRDVLRQHLESGADLTVGTIPVDRKAATGFGIMHTDESRRIIEFVEKPKDPAVLDSLRIPAISWKPLAIQPACRPLSGLDGHLCVQTQCSRGMP